MANAKVTTDTTTTTELPKSYPQSQRVIYTKEELEAMKQVLKVLVEEHNIEPGKIGPRVLALTTILNKNRVDDSVKAFLKFKEAVALVDMDGFDEQVTHDVEDYIGKCYEACGMDDFGRQVMWIHAEHNASPDEEKLWIQAGIVYWMAIHADSTSLREGIHFVIDVTDKPADKYGNAQKLQKVTQAYPLRPQSIRIAGSNFASRIVINGIIKVASLFAKAKVLQRIKFVSVDDAFQSLPKESSPQYLGGGGGGIDNIVEWVKERLHNLPIPDLGEVVI